MSDLQTYRETQLIKELVVENSRDTNKRLESIENKIDRLTLAVDEMRSEIREQGRKAKDRHFKTMAQIERVDNKVDEIKLSIDQVKRDLKKGRAYIDSMGSDFDGALDEFGVSQHKLKNGKLIYLEEDYEKIFHLNNFVDAIITRHQMENPMSERRHKRDSLNRSLARSSRSLRHHPAQISGAEAIQVLGSDKAVDVSSFVKEIDNTNLSKIESERDKYVDYEIQRAAFRISAECRSLSEASGQPLESSEVYDIVEEVGRYFEECGWGRRSKMIAVSGLSRLANNQKSFNRYAKHHLEAEIDKITDELRDEVSKAELPKTGLFQTMKDLMPFSKSQYEIDNGSMKSLFKANNVCHFIKTAIGSFVSKSIDDFKMKGAVDEIMGSLKKIHDYQSAMDELKEYVLRHDGHAFSLTGEEKIELANPAFQFDTNSDTAKNVRNKAFAIAFEIKNSDFYDHKTTAVRYSDSEKKVAQSIVELCAIMGDQGAQAHLNGQFEMHDDISKSIINRLKRDNQINWARGFSLTSNKRLGSHENPIQRNSRAGKFSGSDLSLY